MRSHVASWGAVLATTFLLWPSAAGADAAAPTAAGVTIPLLAAPPDFDDFIDMRPDGAVERSMARIETFTQRWPSDGKPARQRTVAFLGYTRDALHVVFVAFDDDPSAIRARLVRREEVFQVNDDVVELRLDTFADRRRSYYFVSNPLGVQLDAFWPEVGGAYDESFDALWYSRGRKTKDGFVVWMAIPFRTLRFQPAREQIWGIYLGRWIPRSGEWVFWPPISNRQQSFLSQMATLSGVRDVSTSRGAQVIPYVTSRSFRALDHGNADGPRVTRDPIEARMGADVKVVVRDSLVLDATANPDFSQVETDAPQITTNQRFEVFFPEKRPFFLENAANFRTPINLLFTRRVAAPNLGAKLTGKVGPWSVGTFVADDEGPGQLVGADDPRHGRSAWAGAVRLNRDLFGQSSVGAMATRRVHAGRDNWAGGLDTRLRLSRTWLVDAQAVGSRLEVPGASPSTDIAYLFRASREGRSVVSRTEVNGRGTDFVTDLGFVPRVDVHEAKQTLEYTWRPAKTVTDFGPAVEVDRIWSWDGTPLEWSARPSFSANLVRSTSLSLFAQPASVALRSGDVPGLTQARRYRTNVVGVSAGSQPSQVWSFSGSIAAGSGVNYAPASGEPEPGGAFTSSVTIGLRPASGLRIDNTWLRSSLSTTDGAHRIFTTDIIRTQWAWQFSREWAVRFIGQLDRTDADPAWTRTEARRSLNADLLVSYTVNPWTAFYIGYNGNLRDQELVEIPGRTFLRRAPSLRLDAWQVFAKWSYLVRF